MPFPLLLCISVGLDGAIHWGGNYTAGRDEEDGGRCIYSMNQIVSLDCLRLELLYVVVALATDILYLAWVFERDSSSITSCIFGAESLLAVIGDATVMILSYLSLSNLQA